MRKTKEINKSGITLISLVITILVLIILAGVSFQALTGDSGIIDNIMQGKEKSEMSVEMTNIQNGLLLLAENNLGNVTTEKIKTYVEKEIAPRTVDVYNIGSDEFIVIYQDSKREYIVNSSLEVTNTKDNSINKNTTILAGSGTEDAPIEITSIEDLLQLSYNTGGITVNSDTGELVYGTGKTYSNLYIVLKNNLDFKSSYSYVDCKRTDYGDVNGNGIVEPLITEMTTGSGFIPIGNSTSKFCGSFNGSNLTISNLMINTTGDAGLFGYINQASVLNLYIENCNIKAETYSAAIVAIASTEWLNTRSTTITNCIVKSGTINSTTSSVGGLVARANGTNNVGLPSIQMTNCDNYATIIGQSYAGGIVGYDSLGPMIFNNCNNYGEVSGKYTAGILGNNYYVRAIVNIYKCNNYGELYGSTNCAGICSAKDVNTVMGPLVIDSCCNYGKVEGTSDAGGIANMNAQIYNCINFGEVKGNSMIGGIITRRNKILINSCNLGKVAGGEISAYYDTFCLNSIQNSYASGKYLEDVKAYVVRSVASKATLDLSGVYKYTGMPDVKSGTVATSANEFTANDLATEEGLMATLNSFVDEYNSTLADGGIELVKWKMGENGYPVLEFID